MAAAGLQGPSLDEAIVKLLSAKEAQPDEKKSDDEPKEEDAPKEGKGEPGPESQADEESK